MTTILYALKTYPPALDYQAMGKCRPAMHWTPGQVPASTTWQALHMADNPEVVAWGRWVGSKNTTADANERSAQPNSTQVANPCV